MATTTIARLVMTVLAAAGLNLVSTGPAQAQMLSPVANGRACGLQSTVDPRVADEQTWVGALDAGPLVAAEPGAATSMTCTIQVGWGNQAHAAADVVAVSSEPGPGVTAIPPAPVSFRRGPDQPFYVCAQVTVADATYYRDARDSDGDPWSTDPGVACAPVGCSERCDGPPPGPLGPLFGAVDAIVDETAGAVLDPLVCSLTRSLAPGVPGYVSISPDGDVYLGGRTGHLVWSCPTAGDSQ